MDLESPEAVVDSDRPVMSLGVGLWLTLCASVLVGGRLTSQLIPPHDIQHRSSRGCGGWLEEALFMDLPGLYLMLPIEALVSVRVTSWEALLESSPL